MNRFLKNILPLLGIFLFGGIYLSNAVNLQQSNAGEFFKNDNYSIQLTEFANSNNFYFSNFLNQEKLSQKFLAEEIVEEDEVNHQFKFVANSYFLDPLSIPRIFVKYLIFLIVSFGFYHFWKYKTLERYLLLQVFRL
ncbi:hypothetical protein EGI22_11775 [Lacihabitans sp. LS3-19]|uniref:hypothetical protein n=1 Tax=Lacihabitans sp. LS3-19 TaxID=2487335 RepID=UPI0020CCE36B|nr:hypothetical protein [Lacihabitans sp. LS3-19]MCP9768594.1 hypothetical protein [Lacihabitans sp. LS3-19]